MVVSTVHDQIYLLVVKYHQLCRTMNRFHRRLFSMLVNRNLDQPKCIC